ncbi:MAG: hypothetical protein A2V70_15765 [Planctomycetes bacterium RBG_13_63_9]|nr:MAG: hypothetical protein A2V70_15765 [Planctomycetes bacterium RBG_13_63_9]
MFVFRVPAPDRVPLFRSIAPYGEYDPRPTKEPAMESTPRLRFTPTRCLALLVLCALVLCPYARGLAGERLKFVFISPCRDEAFFGPVKKGMADAARLMDVECEFVGTEDVDLKAQAEMVHKAVADGYDGIALNIIDPVAFDEVVRQAIDKGVPVVAFNVDDHATPNARLSAVCQDLYQAGVTLGKRAGESIPPGSKVLATLHSEGISALDDRLRGAQDALKEKNLSWRVVVSGNEPEKALEVIAKELAADPEIRAVLCTGLTDTEAAGLAASRRFPDRSLVVAGFDLSADILRLVKTGTIRFTIDQQPYVQGFYPVVHLAQYCRYGIKPANVDAGATIITAKDVDRVIELSRKGYR